MTGSQVDGRELRVGGPLDAAADIYVTRGADREFMELVERGEFVNLVTSRQMGKTSLVYQAMARLSGSQCRFAYYDLSAIAKEPDRQSFFETLVRDLERQLALGIDLEAFWAKRERQSASQSFIDFFREVLALFAGRIVIVLDEIDSTLESKDALFTDDLFTAIRSMYVSRPREAAFRRLGFCLVGVATPNELIKARRTTPYNIGRTIWLGDFDPRTDDVTPLLTSLGVTTADAMPLLDRVLYWTGGQPYLTAWTCEQVRLAQITNASGVDALIEREFTSLERLHGNTHFAAATRFLNERVADSAEVLDLYERILQGKREPDQVGNVTYAHLKLSGLVKADAEGALVVRNRIYQRLFDREWVQRSRPRRELRRTRRFAYAASVLLVTSLVGGAIYYQTRVAPLQARENARDALEKLGVSHFEHLRGWAEFRLPDRDTQKVLADAAPHIAAFGAASDSKGGVGVDLSYRTITDLGPLAKITGLKRLNLTNTQIADLTPLAGLTSLKRLDLPGTPVADVRPLARLRRLEELDLSGTQVADLVPLGSLERLKALSISATQAKDLSPLATLTSLERLDVSANIVTDLRPIGSLGKLIEIDISSTQVSDLAAVRSWQSLVELNVSRTPIADLSALEELTSLRVLGTDAMPNLIASTIPRTSDLHVLRGPAVRSSSARPAAGEVFRDCAECPQMVMIPAGEFVMGSPDNEADRQADEGPQHPVKIQRPFAVGKFEVRMDEWALCVQAKRCPALDEEGWGRSLRPVTNVNWSQANAYAAWLSERSGKTYRLITESQWEYVARAGTRTARHWGETFDPDGCRYANIADQTLRGVLSPDGRQFAACVDGAVFTAPVGSLQANAFGVHDILGNVWEWTQDCWNDSYNGAPADGNAWMTGTCGRRVVRGGGWNDEPQLARAAIRDRNDTTERNVYLGFRLARTE